MKNQKVPVVGVSAPPISDDLKKWHANIKNVGENIYKGLILHLEIVFPDKYPMAPPTITVLNSNSGLKHNSIMSDGKVCLDMLNPATSEPYSGWTSAYSVLSILIQLQNFFFDQVWSSYLYESDKEIIRKANEFTCKCCIHKGSSNPFPEFPAVDPAKDKKNFLMSREGYIESLKNELSCVIRKSSYEENPLGYGINIVRLHRTGEIKNITIVQEYLSLKAFMKQNIRSVGFETKATFTRWFPVYFGINKDQVLYLTKKSISMISTGSTKNFAPDQIIKVYPKMFNTLVTDIINEKNFMSCKSLKILTQIYRSFRLLLAEYPEIQDKIDSTIDAFIKDPVSRIKENCPSLGDILCFACLTSKSRLRELIPVYMEEGQDRSIFWSIKLVPDLETVIANGVFDENLLKACYKAGNSGFLQFYYYFITNILRKETIKTEDIDKRIDSEFGGINEDEAYSHLKSIKASFKIETFNELNQFLGLGKLSNEEAGLKIKQAFNNSLAKKYHGDIDELRFVPLNSSQEETVWPSLRHSCRSELTRQVIS